MTEYIEPRRQIVMKTDDERIVEVGKHKIATQQLVEEGINLRITLAEKNAIHKMDYPFRNRISALIGAIDLYSENQDAGLKEIIDDELKVFRAKLKAMQTGIEEINNPKFHEEVRKLKDPFAELIKKDGALISILELYENPDQINDLFTPEIVRAVIDFIDITNADHQFKIEKMWGKPIEKSVNGYKTVVDFFQSLQPGQMLKFLNRLSATERLSLLADYHLHNLSPIFKELREMPAYLVYRASTSEEERRVVN
ncbi:MAG: hypothetical protein V1898_05305 [Patescibacteria group bacterium]